MNNFLSDRDTYIPLRINPVHVYKIELEKIVNRGFLVPLAVCTPIMYYLPKIHKKPVCPLGRPIISGMDSVTSRVGKYIDFYLL